MIGKVVVKFESNGGVDVPSMIINNGFMIKVPHSTKMGYDFDGWYIDKELKNEFDANKIIEQDLTLYARWNNYAPKKFINDISVYTNLSNVVKDYQKIYGNTNTISADEANEIKREKVRIDKSNYVEKLIKEYNLISVEYKEVAIELNKTKATTSKIKEKMDKKIQKKGDLKSKKIIKQYNEALKKEELKQKNFDDIVSKLDTIELKYEEFALKNR